MRRNLTLSFDDEWIRLLDKARGDQPRSRFIEDQMSNLELLAEVQESLEDQGVVPRSKRRSRSSRSQ